MRLTNDQIFNRSMRDMSKTQNRLNEAHTQITSLKKHETSADAPADVAKASYLADEVNKNTQYQKNGTLLRSTLGLEEATLDNIHTAMERARVLTVRALNGTVDQVDRDAIAIEIDEVQKEAFNLVNTKNANGDHIFSGSASQIQSFVWNETTSLYEFRGNEQDNQIQVSSNVFIDSSDNGRRVFDSSPARLDALATNPVGAITSGSVRVADQGEYDNFHDLNYDYTTPANNVFKLNVLPPLVPGQPETYEIRDSLNTVRQAGNFTSDENIRFAGLHIKATGGATGSLDVTLADPENTNILNTLENLKTVLRDSNLTKTEFQDGISDAQVEINNAKFAVMSTISSIGGRNNTIERITDSNESFKIINQEAMAILSEADIAAAMTDLTKEQNVLEMSYKSFNKINGLSLFNSL